MRKLATLLNLTIRTKFTLASSFIAALSILLVSTASIYAYSISARESMVRELNSLALVVGSNITAALIFEDSEAAREVLHTLRLKPDIVQAVVLGPDGERFASYRREGSSGDAAPDPENEQISVVSAVKHQNENVGSVWLSASLADLHRQTEEFMWLAASSTLGAAFFAFFLSSLIQRAMLKPMLHLVGKMRQVSDRKDYSIRAAATTRDELGRLIAGFNEMLQEIENRHRELEAYRSNLEELVGRRTQELSVSNARLRESFDELQRSKIKIEEASKAKSTFLANMSHELRTPLNAIIGFSEILKNESFGPLGAPPYKEYCTDIFVSGHHLLSVINQILDLTKIETGKLELEESATSVSSILSHCHKVLMVNARAKEIAFPRPETDCGDTVFVCDVTRIRQILMNLLTNAIKFTSTKGKVVLRARRTDSYLIFSVTDNGIGVDEKSFEHIFLPFGQVENAYSRSNDGVGIGLPLSRALAQAHGGDIRIESKVGSGTTMSLLIPASRITPDAAGKGEPQIRSSA
jgi:signal transduction histidine kinase